MPFNLLEQLYNRLRSVETKLDEQNKLDIGTMDLSSGLGSVSEEEMQKISTLSGMMFTAMTVTKEKITDGKPLSPNDAGFVKSFYDDLIRVASNYVAQDLLYLPAGMEAVNGDLEQALTVFRFQAEQLGKIAEGAQPKTMNEILSDYAWVADVFNDDPNMEKNRAKTTSKWNYNEHTLKENLDKYKECAGNMEIGYLQHMRDLTGDNDNPERAFTGKLWLLQTALNSAAGKGLADLESVQSVHQDYKNKLYLGNVKDLHHLNILSGTYLNEQLGKMFNVDGFKTHFRESNRMDPATTEAFCKALDKLKMKPERIGVDPDSFQALDDASVEISLAAHIKKYLISSNDNVNPLDKGNNKDPLYGAMKKINEIDVHIRNYLNGNSDELGIETDAFGNVIDYLADYAKKAPLFNAKGEYNSCVDAAIECCELIGSKLPQFAERAAIAKQGFEPYKKKALAEPYKNFAKSAINSDDFDKYFNQIVEGNKARKISDNELYKAQAIRICRDTDYCNRMIKSNDPRMVLLACVAKNEYNCAVRFAQSDQSLKSQILHPFNHAIFEGLNDGNAVLSDDQVKNLERFCSKTLKSFGAKEYLENYPDNIEYAFNEKNIDNLIYDNPMPKALSGETLDALCQSSGNFYANNSQQYTDIGTAMKNLAAHAHEPDGPSGEVYKGLYDACLTYMYTHNSVPSTTNGKLRFKAAATVLAEIAPKLIEKMPELKDQIKLDVKTNMIRSKFFRDECVKNSRPLFKSMANRVETVLESEMGKPQITGKLPEADMQRALLHRFADLDQSFTAKQAKAVEQAKSNDGMKIL